MGKGTDKLYITHSEWSSSDAFSASKGARSTNDSPHPFKRLPFHFCAASLQPFENAVCTSDGTIFDAEVIASWLAKKKKKSPNTNTNTNPNPVTGAPLSPKDLIKLNFSRNAAENPDKGDLIDPVTFKVFTDTTHIVAIRHGDSANVFAWDTIQRMNIKPKMWLDLVNDQPFTRKDIITLQDPLNASTLRDLNQFAHLRDGGAALLTPRQEAERAEGNVNVGALGRVGEKVLRAKEAVERARREREAGGDANKKSSTTANSRSVLAKSTNPATFKATSQIQDKKKLAHNAANYTTGRAAASFTSTGLTPETSGERALLSDEDFLLKPRRVKIPGYARIETNHGSLNLELHTEWAPRAVWNFIRLAQRGYYRGTAFHRNIRNFMIQAGDPTGTGRGGDSVWGKNFNDEVDGPLTHDTRGVLSMANKGKNTNSSQFFLTYRPVPHLDRKHTVFGRLVGGQDVLKKLEDLPTDGSDRPLRKIEIKEVVVYVDPFAEFWRKREERENGELVRKREMDEDETVTWTGKRMRRDGKVEKEEEKSREEVGRYLKARRTGMTGTTGTTGTTEDEIRDEDEVPEVWEEPVKKKPKSAGFGNFDGW